MKKWIALLMALVLCLSLLCACGKKPAADESTPPSVSVTPSEEPSEDPAEELSEGPSEEPSAEPSEAPSSEPSEAPSQAPDATDPAEPTLTLSAKDVTITYAGYVLKLKPTFTGVKESALTWTSSDEAVASVDEKGSVTSVAPGKAVITAKAENGLEASCIVRCRWTEETSAPPESTDPIQQPTGVDLSAFAASMISKYELPSFLSLADDELVANYYAGLESLAANQKLVYVNMMSMNMGELVLVEVKNSADVATVKAILQARIDYMSESGAWYPAPTEVWTNDSRVVSSGNYVMMVVDDDCDAIVSEFNKLF